MITRDNFLIICSLLILLLASCLLRLAHTRQLHSATLTLTSHSYFTYDLPLIFSIYDSLSSLPYFRRRRRVFIDH